jgi:hypothetical protein
LAEDHSSFAVWSFFKSDEEIEQEIIDENTDREEEEKQIFLQIKSITCYARRIRLSEIYFKNMLLKFFQLFLSLFLLVFKHDVFNPS